MAKPGVFDSGIWRHDAAEQLGTVGVHHFDAERYAGVRQPAGGIVGDQPRFQLQRSPLFRTMIRI